jgi:hypothetical protein
MNPIDIETITTSGVTTAVNGDATVHIGGKSLTAFERNHALVSIEGDGVIAEDLTETGRGFVLALRDDACLALGAALLAHYGTPHATGHPIGNATGPHVHFGGALPTETIPVVDTPPGTIPASVVDAAAGR